MKPTVMILGSDSSQSDRISILLEANGYQPETSDDFSILSGGPTDKPVSAVILDLDAIAPDNHLFRLFKRKNPDTVLLAISSESFHPDLRESMEKYIFACMHKPVDPDEVLLLLKSGFDQCV